MGARGPASTTEAGSVHHQQWLAHRLDARARGGGVSFEGRRWASALGWLRVQGRPRFVGGGWLLAVCWTKAAKNRPARLRDDRAPRHVRGHRGVRWILAFRVKETGPQQAAARIPTQSGPTEVEHQSSHASPPLQALAREQRGRLACVC